MKLIRRKPNWTKTWFEDSRVWESEFSALPPIVTAAIVFADCQDLNAADKASKEGRS